MGQEWEYIFDFVRQAKPGSSYNQETELFSGWSINGDAFYKDGATAATSAGIASADYPFYAGAKYADRATAPFRVSAAGVLYATGATITGTISANWGDVVDDGGKPANNADVTNSILQVGTIITGGGITLSNGGNIKGGQTAYNTGTGFFLGYSSGYKFSIGDASTHYMTWDGAGLLIGGTFSAISYGGAIPMEANSANTFAVYGVSTNSSGVVGTSEAASYAGVNGGNSGAGPGVYGSGHTGYGVSGYSAHSYGVYANTGDGTYALYSTKGAYINSGNVVIAAGSMYCIGGFIAVDNNQFHNAKDEHGNYQSLIGLNTDSLLVIGQSAHAGISIGPSMTGNIYMGNDVILLNAHNLFGIDSGGSTARHLIGWGSDNVIYVGHEASYATKVNIGNASTEDSPVYIRVSGASSKQITSGANDSGGAGYRMLVVANI